MSRYEGKSAESNALSLLECFFSFSHGAKPSSSMFLVIIFGGRGDFRLGDPLAQSHGAEVKTFYAEISFGFIFEI